MSEEDVAAAIVAEHVLVATDDDASVAWTFILYAPDTYESVSGFVDVPVLQRSATGATPPDVVAVHVIVEVAEAPEHETDNVLAPAVPAEKRNTTASAAAPRVRVCIRNV